MPPKAKDIARKLAPSFYTKYMSYVLRIEALEKALITLSTDDLWKPDSDEGFNGQEGRRRIVDRLFKSCRFKSVVETGTWIGSTTGYLSHHYQVPVHTCELSRVFQAVAMKRLRNLPGVHFHLGNSAAILPGVLKNETHREPLFFYLDAHWQEELPLESEINTIAGAVGDWVALVDDFEVPGDDGYGFDDYGPGKRLTLEDFQNAFSRNHLGVFFPTIPSATETGRSRGYALLASQGKMTEILRGLPDIKESNVS